MTTHVAGHFGEWVQGLWGPDRTLALITQVCPVAGVGARVEPADAFALRQTQPVLDDERCQRFLGALDISRDCLIDLSVDLPPGGGAGMSTAALVAIARASGAGEDTIAAVCLAIEGATDPLMLTSPDQVLWAPRAARVLSSLPSPPEAEVVGGFWGQPCQTDPDDLDFPAVDDLIAAWQNGPALAEAARLASDSCARTTAMRGPIGDPTPDIARGLGALGVSRAHTGPARSFIFQPGRAPAATERTLQDAGYTHVIRFRTGGRR